MNGRLTNLVLVAAFAFVIALPLAGWVLPIAPEVHLRENRALAPPPGRILSYDDLEEFPRRFDRYYDDHFGFRDLLVKAFARLDNALPDIRDRVIHGEAGWYFLARGIRDIDPIPIVRDLCGKAPFNAGQLAGWVGALEANATAARQRGIVYLVVIVPNKHTIHGRFLPEEFRCTDRVTRLDQLMNVLDASPDLHALDLRTAMRSAYDPSTAQYRQTDTHWNALGQFAGYRAIMERLEDLTGADLAIDTERLVIYSDTWGGGDLAAMVDLPRDYKDLTWNFAIHDETAEPALNPLPGLTTDPSRQPARFHNPGGNGKHLLLFHDSFTNEQFRAVFAETFTDSTFVWWGPPALDFDVIDRVRPDIVIQQMVERNLLHPHF